MNKEPTVYIIPSTLGKEFNPDFFPEIVKKVIETTSFDKIQEQEKKLGFSESKTTSSGKKINFFNQGPNNRWEKNLDLDIKNEIENVFGNEMTEIGYL